MHMYIHISLGRLPQEHFSTDSRAHDFASPPPRDEEPPGQNYFLNFISFVNFHLNNWQTYYILGDLQNYRFLARPVVRPTREAKPRAAERAASVNDANLPRLQRDPGTGLDVARHC